MKDQIRLLRDCFHNEIPAVVFQGNDSCAGEILEAAKKIYQKHGCSQEFLYDWQMLINEVKAYQQESPEQFEMLSNWAFRFKDSLPRPFTRLVELFHSFLSM